VLLAVRFIGVSHRLCSLFPRDDRESDSHHESEGYGSKRDSLASCRSPATSKDIFCLPRCRLWFLFSTSLREPLLSCAQIFTAQDEAIVFTFVFPLNCTRE
jgi:hypothetical protein